MKYKMTKKLIVLGAIIFSFAFIFISNISAYSCSGYSCVDTYDPYYEYNLDNNYRTSRNNNSYESSSYNLDTTGSSNSVVNNYYYPVATSKTPSTSSVVYDTMPVTEAKVNTSSNTNTNSTTTDTSRTYTDNNSNISNSGINGNLLGASAGNSEITALSLGGSGSFMPSSVWQWIFVVILILVIIILARMFVKKPSPYDHDVHAH